MPTRPARLAAALAALLLLTAFALPGRARADGYYLSLDYAPTQPQGVLSIDRGPVTLASAVGRGTDGLLWAKSAVLYVWKRGALRLKAGPSLYVKEWEAWRLRDPATAPAQPADYRLGLRLGADSYVDRGSWASYWMVEYDSTQHALLVAVSGDLKASGLGAELSVWREAGERPAPTILARWRPPGQDYAIRVGWRPKDREAFFGVSLARFR